MSRTLAVTSTTMFFRTVAGFCAVTKILPLPLAPAVEVAVAASDHSGLNVQFNGANIHCIAAEPDTTFVHFCVVDDTQEVAFETAVLGRLRPGYRAIRLRSVLGTRIELACVLVRIRFDVEMKYAHRDRTQHRTV